eukprot:gi/632983787/ref/XP_007908819.1/ PREDICTED: poliovirus receptor-related protein 3-like isoform X1 [Callorhinchus milii]
MQCSLWAETLMVLGSLILGAVSVAPTDIIELSPHIPVANRGESTIATCLAKNAKPATSINWESPFYFSFTQSTTPPAPDGTVNVSSTRRLSPTREMNGQYVYCVVEHPALKTPERLGYQLNIHYVPSVAITIVKTDQDNLQLKCNADANPPSIGFRWTRMNDTNPIFNKVQDDSILKVPILTSDNNRLYMCETSNIIGSAKSSIYLHQYELQQRLHIMFYIIIVLLVTVIAALSFLLIRKKICLNKQ